MRTHDLVFKVARLVGLTPLRGVRRLILELLVRTAVSVNVLISKLAAVDVLRDHFYYCVYFIIK